MVLYRFLFAPVLLAVAVLMGSPQRPAAAAPPAAARDAAGPAPSAAQPQARIPGKHPAAAR